MEIEPLNSKHPLAKQMEARERLLFLPPKRLIPISLSDAYIPSCWEITVTQAMPAVSHAITIATSGSKSYETVLPAKLGKCESEQGVGATSALHPRGEQTGRSDLAAIVLTAAHSRRLQAKLQGLLDKKKTEAGQTAPRI